MGEDKVTQNLRSLTCREKRKPTKWDKLAQATTRIKKHKDPDQHPLYDLIIEKFTKDHPQTCEGVAK